MAIEQIHRKYFFKNHRLLYNKAKLRAISRTSALLSGFSMIAMVEVQLGDYDQPKTSIPLVITYSTLTCLVVGIHLLALMISTCILSVIETDGLLNFKEYETIQVFIEIAWILSSGFGIFLFLLEITIICWVKFFYTTHQAAIASTIIIIPLIILFCIFSLHYYRRLIILKLNHHQSEINEIEHRLTIIKLPIVNVI